MLKYFRNEKALVLNLGRITVSSVDKSGTSYNVKHMLSSGKNEDEVLQQLMISCYDHFNITLSDAQVRFIVTSLYILESKLILNVYRFCL